MTCPKCGNDMENSMYCSNCNTYPFKDKQVNEWKKTLKITIITIGCFVLLFAAIMGVTEISYKQKINEEINAEYEEIYEEYENEEYYSALSSIESFKSHHKDNKKIIDKIEELSDDIETALYNNISSESDIEKAKKFCSDYIEFFPNSSRLTEVNKKYSEIINALAPIRIAEAKQCISAGEYLEANQILGNIADNDKISKQYINEAQGIKNSISEIVKYETPVNASVQDLLSDAIYYSNRKVILTSDVIVASVDRERKMLLVYPVSDNTSLGYDYSFPLEIYYGALSNQSRWGSISSNDDTELNYIKGRFKIYSNRNNSGYIEAEDLN